MVWKAVCSEARCIASVVVSHSRARMASAVFQVLAHVLLQNGCGASAGKLAAVGVAVSVDGTAGSEECRTHLGAELMSFPPILGAAGRLALRRILSPPGRVLRLVRLGARGGAERQLGVFPVPWKVLFVDLDRRAGNELALGEHAPLTGLATEGTACRPNREMTSRSSCGGVGA